MNVSDFLRSAELVLVCIFAVAGFFVIFNTIDRIGLYFYEKANSIRKKELGLAERITTTNEFIQIIDATIRTEYNTIINRFAILQAEYPVNRIDEDVKVIATTVFDSLKPELFKSDELCYTEDYLLRFITERTKVLALTIINEYNTLIRHPELMRQFAESIYDEDDE